MYARFQFNSKESLLIIVIKILRYLIETQNKGLWYSKQSSIDLISYSNTNFVECKLNWKNTSKTCQFLVMNLVSLFSKK